MLVAYGSNKKIQILILIRKSENHKAEFSKYQILKAEISKDQIF